MRAGFRRHLAKGGLTLSHEATEVRIGICFVPLCEAHSSEHELPYFCLSAA